jgi:hypothetical protein
MCHQEEDLVDEDKQRHQGVHCILYRQPSVQLSLHSCHRSQDWLHS